MMAAGCSEKGDDIQNVPKVCDDIQNVPKVCDDIQNVPKVGGDIQNIPKDCDLLLSFFFIFLYLSLFPSSFFFVLFYLQLSFPLSFLFSSFPSFFFLRFSLLFYSPCESNEGICEMEAKLHAFFTSARDKPEWSASHSCRFGPERQTGLDTTETTKLCFSCCDGDPTRPDPTRPDPTRPDPTLLSCSLPCKPKIFRNRVRKAILNGAK